MDVRQTRHLLYWSLCTAILPLTFIAAVWAMARYLLGHSDSFGEAFGTGDLFPLAVLVLLTIYAEIRLTEETRAGYLMALTEVWFILLAVLGILAYGAVKPHALELLRRHNADDTSALDAFATLSWCFTIYVMVHSIVIKHRLLKAS
jgi:MFS family permease